MFSCTDADVAEGDGGFNQTQVLSVIKGESSKEHEIVRKVTGMGNECRSTSKEVRAQEKDEWLKSKRLVGEFLER